MDSFQRWATVLLCVYVAFYLDTPWYWSTLAIFTGSMHVAHAVIE